MASSKSVITIATGKQVYINMAVALARSFYVWNKNTGINFYIATDNAGLLPADVLEYVHIIELKPKQYGEGFSPKLYLDKMAPSDQTLFIDSDCLVVHNLLPIFEKFAGKAVSVLGGYMSEGDWFGDVAAICKQFNVSALPKFNGGIYYIEKGETATKVYEKARELEPLYEKIGLKLLRNRPNDELLMAIAMAVHGQKVLIDDGSIMSDPQACPAGMHFDVFKGESLLINPPAPHPLHQAWYNFHKVSPAVVHLLGYYTTKYPYIREEAKLKFVLLNKWPVPIASFVAFLGTSLPFLCKEYLKFIFRPVYRLLFGFRKVKTSERI